MDIQIKSSRVVLATDSAIKKLKELKLAEDSENSFLRMGVKPGGCSGYSYEMFFDTEKFEGDSIEEYDGGKLYDKKYNKHIVSGKRIRKTKLYDKKI